MSARWYEKAIIYCLDVDSFQDADGDGVGDFRGLIRRLDYLARLGVNCLWLNPIHPSPGRDDGYDVTDFYNVHPKLGTLGDFAELLQAASSRGIRVMIDLVVNHTSDEHPWFVSARSSPDSPYRDWYVWSKTEPADRKQGMVFPGEQEETWTYDETAGAWYYHRFYKFQPDLNVTNPRVRAEIKKICSFWLQLGVTGFRMDAVPFIIERTEPGRPDAEMDFDFLTELRQHLQWQRGDAVLLAEANVEPEQLKQYFGDAGGSANRLHMLFDFMLNGRVMLALARRDPESIIEALRDTPALPTGAQWATFLRNHDEVDLSRLTSDQRQDVFAQFGPDQSMRLYDRGIRRRLAPMLGGDQRRIELAYSLQFSLRGTPVLRYGEEIGMGEDLSLQGARGHPDPDAVVSGAQRRLLHRRPQAAGASGRHRRRLRLRARQRQAAAQRQRLPAGLVRADDAHPARVPRDQHRLVQPRGRAHAARCAGPPGRRRHRHRPVPAQPRRAGRHRRPAACSRTWPRRPPRCSPTATTATSTWASSPWPGTATAGSGSAAICHPPAQGRNSGQTLARGAADGRTHAHSLDTVHARPCRSCRSPDPPRSGAGGGAAKPH